MFISNLEKSRIEARLKLLEERVEQLGRSLNAVLDAQTMASKTNAVKFEQKAKEEAKLTEMRAARQRAHAKAYYYRKKAEKAEKAAAQTPKTTQE